MLVASLLIFLIAGCGSSVSKTKEDPNKVSIVTTLYPLQDFANKIGGKYVSVTNLVPTGTEPHDFEPSAKDLANLSHADIFVYNGSGLEAWVDKAISNLDQSKTKVVSTSEGLPLLHKEEEETNHDQEHDHGKTDPHVWLDPMLAKEQAKKIKDTLIKVDPAHQEEYNKNFTTLEKQLNDLDQEYKEMIASAKSKEFVTSHAAFSYLAHRYGLKQISISGLSPENEPSPKEIKKVIEEAKAHQVKVIFFETLVSGKVAEIVKNELKAEALQLNPLEGLTQEEISNHEDYFSVMKKNKENLAKALGANK